MEKCKAGLYRPFQKAYLNVQDRLYATAGSYFKLIVFDLAMINLTKSGKNMIIISELLHVKQSVLDINYANNTNMLKPVSA